MEKFSDLHIHTNLSPCSSDPRAVIPEYVNAAQEIGLKKIAITDHMWDEAGVGSITDLFAREEHLKEGDKPHWALDFYTDQGIDHISQYRPDVPKNGPVKVLFGCETDYLYDHWGIGPEAYSRLDIVLTPHSHMHMIRYLEGRDAFSLAAYHIRTLEALMRHTACRYIAHPLFPVGIPNHQEVIGLYDLEDIRRLARLAVREGKVWEVNLDCFPANIPLSGQPYVKVLRAAKEEGLRFTVGSDSHSIARFYEAWARYDAIMDELGFTPDDLDDIAK